MSFYLHSRILLGALLLASFASACQVDDSWEGEEIVLDIHSDQPLDEIVVYEGHSCTGCVAPLTPNRIAMGVVTPTGIVYKGTGQGTGLSPPTKDIRYAHAEPFSFVSLSKLLVLGYRRDAGGQRVLVSAATADPTFLDGRRFHAAMTLTGAGVPQIEVWGSKECAAAGGVLFIDPADHDCDGIPGSSDCNDGLYCDPAATSPAARAACQTRTCEPCLGEINGACSLGTQAVCHDGTGTPRAYTCEASASCAGAATCLPAGACQLGCKPTSYTRDPLECVLRKWSMTTAAPDSTNCRIPAMAGPSSNVTCSNGSAVEVALPYTSCANPELELPRFLDENWTLTMSPSCTLRLETKSTLSFDRRDLLVVFQSNGSTKTVRLALQAQAGTCGTIGSCDPVPTTALCSP